MQLVTADSPRRFAQIWASAATGEWVVREGTIGRAGTVRETGLNPDAVTIERLAAPYLSKGYVPADEDRYAHVVVQFPAGDSTADRRLIARATEWLELFLDERGLGYVDGFDRGYRGGDSVVVVNIFARVCDGELGSVAAMAALRKGRVAETRATIAHRGADVEGWTVRYERVAAKIAGPFSL